MPHPPGTRLGAYRRRYERETKRTPETKPEDPPQAGAPGAHIPEPPSAGAWVAPAEMAVWRPKTAYTVRTWVTTYGYALVSIT